tara:strand:- start:940 stop:1137 length:198 start_codon:yes stop_codon:yes gene_type:complete
MKGYKMSTIKHNTRSRKDTQAVNISDQAHMEIPKLQLIASNDLGMVVNMGQAVSWAINQAVKTSK